MAFAQHVATRLRDLPSVWLADQVALAETADEFGDDFEIADLSRLPELFDFHLFSETSQIWSGKGQRKYLRDEYVAETNHWRDLEIPPISGS